MILSIARIRFTLLIASLSIALSAMAGEPARCAGGGWWSLQPVRHPAVPKLTHGEIHNPIDAFIAAKLAAEGLHMAPPADRATLIRRVAFDLLGLPPAPEEVAAFVNDRSPDAYEKLVDRLLASPHYGEHWGRHWLDVARFSESQGFERDKVRDHAWRYRDYVIRSLNDDKPYDRFVREQIAGDVMPEATPESVAATGFLVAGPYDEAGNSSVSVLLKARIREEELEDIVSAVSQTFVGLTANCARCHDHKFDPIPQSDYYRLKAVFEGVRHGDRPLVPESELRRRRDHLAKLSAAIAKHEKRIAELEWAVHDKLTGAKSSSIPVALPTPISRWTFDGDARDSIGKLDATLRGSARIAHGRLVLDGKTAFAQTAPLPYDLREKTLEAWVTLANRTQSGGGVVSVQLKGGSKFDAIVFGEREPGKWLPGSEFFRRSRDLDAPAETANLNELVHVALVYSSDGKIALYRNGKSYAKPYKPEIDLQTYPAGMSQVLFGLRHTGAGNGFLAGEIEEARLYDRALNAKQIASSYQSGPAAISRNEIIKAFTPAQRDEHIRLSRELANLRASARRFRVKLASPTPPIRNSRRRRTCCFAAMSRNQAKLSRRAGCPRFVRPSRALASRTMLQRANAATGSPTGSPIRPIRSRPASLSIACGSIISAAASSRRRAISVSTAVGHRTLNCSIGWPTNCAATAGV